MTQHIELSASALKHNIMMARQHLSHQQCWPCIKSNAYGHGMHEVARVLHDHVDGFCVVSTTEALALRRDTNKPIFVLNTVEPEELNDCLDEGIILTLASDAQGALYAACGREVEAHLEVDTGMARSGFRWKHPSEMVEYVRQLPENIHITGLWSHYAAAGENHAFTQQQYEHFERFVLAYKQEISEDILVHFDKSATIFDSRYQQSDSWRSAFRLGIGTYGFDPEWGPNGVLRPVLTWKSQVTSIRTVGQNEPVGYGLTFTAFRDTQIATIPVGYADGLPRALSNRGYVLIQGVRCPIRGRVCMNLTMVEVPPEVAVGDEVVVIGQQGTGVISAFDMAEWANTTHYEIVARLRESIPRKIVA